MLAGELLHAHVGFRPVVERLHFLLLPFGGVAHQLVGRLPGVRLVLAADHLQPHAEADVVFAVMRPSHLPDLGNVGRDPLRQIAPEQVHVGMFRRQFPRLTRAAAEIEFWKRLLQRTRPDMRARERVELAFKVYRAPRRPQRLDDRDLLLHQRVALLLRIAHALAFDLALVLAGDQVDADSTARHLVEGRDHLGEQHRVDVTGPRRNQRLDVRGARCHERA